MKKALYLTSALVAASVLALGATDSMAASKAKKTKMTISGSYKATVGYARQGEGFTVSSGKGTAYTGYNEIDVKTDSEIHFKGSTKTNSGIKVGLVVELETDTAKNGGDHIDQSYMTLGGNFGTFALGSTVAAAAALAVNAPSTGALGIAGGDSASWVVKPATVALAAGTGPDIGGNDKQKIRWISPSFSGFTGGVSYVPDLTSGDNNMAASSGNAGTDASQIDLALKYSGKIGMNAISASGAYWQVDQATTAANATTGTEGQSIGVSTTMGAFTIGAGWKEVSTTGDASTVFTQNGVSKPIGTPLSGTIHSKDEEAHNVGVAWKQGPTQLSVNYFNSTMEMATTQNGEDSLTKWTLGATHNVGPGVDFVGSIQHVRWDDELSAVALNNNKGTAFVGGVKVAF
jgi:outer membrane protein OmpU